jgi:CRP/FNR family cyclic AMP-dependent transcriptional regulator
MQGEETAMGIMISPEVLRRYPLFASIEDPLLKKVAMTGDVISVDKRTWLFREGEDARNLYLVLKGEVMIRVSVGTEILRQIGVLKIGKGEILGWSALVEPYSYQLGAECIQNCELARFDGIQLSELMTHHPHLGYIFMSRVTQVIGERLLNLRIRLVSLVEGGRWEQIFGKEPYYIFEGGRQSPDG